MNVEKKPSKKLKSFISFLEELKRSYENAKKKLSEFDSLERHIHWAHEFEFANDRNKRNKLATAYHNERLERRRYKDICVLYEAVYEFVDSDYNKGSLKRLKGATKRQEEQEEYLKSDRTYKRGDPSDTD